MVESLVDLWWSHCRTMVTMVDLQLSQGSKIRVDIVPAVPRLHVCVNLAPKHGLVWKIYEIKINEQRFQFKRVCKESECDKNRPNISDFPKSRMTASSKCWMSRTEEPIVTGHSHLSRQESHHCPYCPLPIIMGHP